MDFFFLWYGGLPIAVSWWLSTRPPGSSDSRTCSQTPEVILIRWSSEPHISSLTSEILGLCPRGALWYQYFSFMLPRASDDRKSSFWVYGYSRAPGLYLDLERNSLFSGGGKKISEVSISVRWSRAWSVSDCRLVRKLSIVSRASTTAETHWMQRRQWLLTNYSRGCAPKREATYSSTRYNLRFFAFFNT